MRRNCTPRAARSKPVRAPLLQDRDIHYNGQHVAVVVAETLEQADAAGALVRVQYRRDEPITSMDAVLDQAYAPKNFRNGERWPPRSTTRRSRCGVRWCGGEGGCHLHHADRASQSDGTARHDRSLGRQSTFTVWTATQGISGRKQTLAGLFGIDKADVHVICPYVGGGFGCKGNTWPPATLAAMAAKVVGKTVKLALTRVQMFHLQRLSPAHRAVSCALPQTIKDISMYDAARWILAKCRSLCFGEFAEPVGLATEMLYACPNVAVTHRLVATNASLPTYMRAPGLSSGRFRFGIRDR